MAMAVSKRCMVWLTSSNTASDTEEEMVLLLPVPDSLMPDSLMPAELPSMLARRQGPAHVDLAARHAIGCHLTH
jgi:hypothetical protein